jgi:hypothetical protein
MSLKGRINRLEKDAGGGDELPYLPLKQDLDDPDIFRNDSKGITVRRGSDEWANLGATHEVILIEYAETWPPGSE